MRSFVIVNPVSGAGSTGRRWPELRRALDRVLACWDHAFTLKPGDGTELARRAALEGYDLLVVVGGDGTAHEALNGLFKPDVDPPELIQPQMRFAPVRNGTGGDFARLFELPHRPPDALSHLRDDGPQFSLDVGVADIAELGRRYFLNIASAGMSGMVDEQVNNRSKRMGGRMSFALGLTETLIRYRRQAVQVRLDGEDFYEGLMMLTAVANGRFFGGGMRIAPNARPNDGLLDLVIATKAGPTEILSLWQVYGKGILDWSTVRVGQGRSVELKPADPKDVVLLDVDGEQLSHAPVHFRILADSLPVQLPRVAHIGEESA